jgi:hypothetical protein
MTEDKIRATLKEAVEKDNPELIRAILDEKADEWDADSMKEYLEESGDIGDTINATIKEKRPNMFTFLKEEFSDSSWWNTEVEIIRVECHHVNYYDKGEAYDVDAKKLYTVNEEGQLVIDDYNFSEIASEIEDYDNLGSDCISADNGNYDKAYYHANDEDIKDTMRRAGIEG